MARLVHKIKRNGGALKSPEQWKQYWRDFKRNVKAKAAEEKRQIGVSGVNGIRKIKSLDDLERRVVPIMTVDIIDGDGVSQERTFSNLRTVSYQEVFGLATPSDINLGIPKTSTSNTNNEKNHTRERRRRRMERFRDWANDAEGREINKYLELEKTKIELKREIFEYQKELDKNELAIETKKADALLSMSESLRDMKHLMQNHYE